MVNFLKKFWSGFVKTYKAIDEFAIRVEHHHIFLIAAGVAFNILLYLIPLLLMSLYIINEIFGIEMIASFLTNIITDILPPNELSKSMLTSTLLEVNMIFGKSSIVGLIGLFSLLWLSSTLFSSFRTGLNTIFDIETPKIFVLYRFKDFLMILIIAVLILYSSYALPLTTVLMSSIQGIIYVPLRGLFTKMSVIMISLSTLFVLFFGLFRFVPNKRQPWFIVLLSTGISVILVELSRNIFSWYVLKFGTYGKFYGAYAVLVSIAFWIYYMILIILLSGELASHLYFKVILPKRELKNKEIPSKSKKAPRSQQHP